MNPMSSLTMYDALTMLTSGFLWCSLFLSGILEKPCESVLFWVACYIVGLIYHRALDGFVSWCEKSESKDQNEQKGKKCAICRKESYSRNSPKLIAKAHAKVQAENPGKLTVGASKTDYYLAYYALAKNNSLGSVPVLEIQAALLRNLILILGVYNFVTCCYGYWIYGMIDCRFLRYLCGVVISLLILWILWLLWRFTQYKIHELVWEGYAFLEETEKRQQKS